MCIFCKLASREIPCDPVFEDSIVYVIADIHPKAPTHLLIIPKQHIESIAMLKDSEKDILSHMFLVARDTARRLNLPGYKLQLNVGKEGGQEVMHLHLHLLA
jgi:histidine triad (HIT) family protein